jgi:uncharacterized protein YggE
MSRILTIVAALMPATLAAADVPAKPGRIISASGTATVRMKPDMARIYFGVRTTDPVSETARELNRKTVKNMTDLMFKQKIDGFEVSTSPVHLVQQAETRFGAVPVAGGVQAPPQLPFIVTQALTATVRDSDPERLKEKINKLVQIAVDNGCNTSGSPPPDPEVYYPGRAAGNGPRVVLMREDDSELRQSAILSATRRAIANAKALAEGAGVKIADTLTVTESSSAGPESNPNYYSNVSLREIAGELELTVRVTVTCSY